jgi:hypothetical protein
MATRSRIGIELEDGTVKSIYCHWDGYPEHNGKILNEHYLDRTKVLSLIKLGNISVLDNSISATVAYHRDRGESYTSPRVNSDIENFFASDIEEFGYVFTNDGNWNVRKGN